jgi:hypothetical protein
MVSAAMALHRTLPFPLNLFEHRGKEIVMSFLIFEDFLKQERDGDVPFLFSLFDKLLISVNRYRLYRWRGDPLNLALLNTFKGSSPLIATPLSTCLVGAPGATPRSLLNP